VAFGLAVAYRLEQEVWSNSLVVASFYGPVNSGWAWGGRGGRGDLAEQRVGQAGSLPFPHKP
jgi:hypothetical protein